MFLRFRFLKHKRKRTLVKTDHKVLVDTQVETAVRLSMLTKAIMDVQIMSEFVGFQHILGPLEIMRLNEWLSVYINTF